MNIDKYHSAGKDAALALIAILGAWVLGLLLLEFIRAAAGGMW